LRQKLYPIKGDITLEKLGITPEDLEILVRECTIVFNSAATIRFSEPINNAVRNNIYSVGQLVEFCNQLDNLEAIVHLSTAYSHCHKKDTIYEVFYKPPMSGSEVQAAVESLTKIEEEIHIYPDSSERRFQRDETEESICTSRDSCEQQRFYFDGLTSSELRNSRNGNLDKQTSIGAGENQRGKITRPAGTSLKKNPYNLLDCFTTIALRYSNRPNTYTFTKAISESYLLDCVKRRTDRYLNGRIPVAIVRPSIVGGAWREPLVGLVDNLNGPTGAILSLYTGALQAMPGRGDMKADLVPVDMVTNMIVSVGWFLVNQGKSSAEESNIRTDEGVYLFNFVSGHRNPLFWHQVTDKIAELSYKFPSRFMVRLPGSYFVGAGKLYDFYDLIVQKFPAYAIHFIKRRLLSQRIDGRSNSVKVYKKIKQMTDTLTPFTSNQWSLCDSNTHSLFEKLSPIDKSIFHFDVKSIDWNEYIRNYIIGSRIYTLRDDTQNLRAAVRSLKR